jgi:hypothetical protein
MATEAARIVINIDTNAERASRSMGQLGKSTRNAGQSAGGASRAFKTLKNIGIAAIALQAAKAVGRLAAATVRAASDAEETANKFGVTFRGINGEAQRTAQSLASNFGLAQDQAQALLADTGDLLTGFGFTRDSALELSEEVNTLAVDLASFTNFSGGAEGASQALTKALLGERESLKSLGIAITEADIQRLAEDKGIVGELTRQQKAALTLELAVQQSGNAIGDFERSQASFANQSRIATARIRDIKVSLGQALLPFANLAVTTFNNLTSGVAETAGQLRDFVQSAEGSARIGEIFGFIAGVFKSIFEIGRSLFEAGFNAWRSIIERVVDEFSDLVGNSQNGAVALNILGGVVEGVILGFQVFGEVVGLAITNIRNAITIAREAAQALGAVGRVLKGEITFEEVKDQFRDVGDAFVDFGQDAADNFRGIIDTAREGIAGFSQNATDRADSIKDAFSEANAQVSANVTETLRASTTVTTEQAGAERELAEASEDAAEAQATLGQTADERAAAAERAISLLEEQAQAEREAALTLAGDEGGGARNLDEELDRLARIRELRAELAEQQRSEIEQLEVDRAAAIENTYGAERDLINELFDLKREALLAPIKEQELERTREFNEEIMEAERERIAAINEASREAAEERIAAAEAERERIKEIRERQRDDTLSILSATADAFADFTAFREALIDRELSALEAQGATEEEIDARRAQLEREQARREKAQSIFAAIINTAEAVVKALSSTKPPASYVLAAISAAAGAAQIATIAAQPLPQAQFGGSFVVPPGNNDDSGLLRVNSGEEVNVTPTRGGEGGFPDRIVVSIGGAEFDARVAQAFNKGSAQIRRRGAVQVNR